MKSILISLLLGGFFTALLAKDANADIKQVRIAHYIVSDICSIPDGFMQYARSCGYNYLLAHGNDIKASSGTNDWGAHDGSYDMKWAKANTSLYSKLIDLFQRADRYGLKLIPCFNTSSSHAGHWIATNKNIKLDSGQDDNFKQWSIPVAIEDPFGMDKSFESYLKVVKEAFGSASVSYPQLDYIHIGHDEIVGSDKKVLFGRWNSDEQNWIRNHGNRAQAYYQLLAEEAVRRVTATKAVLPNTKVIIWADAWDPQSIGGNGGFSAWTGKEYDVGGHMTYHGGFVSVKTMDVATRPELAGIKQDLILMPWQFDTLRYFPPKGYYDSQVTLQYLKENGFKVIIGTASNAPAPESGILIMKQYVRNAKSSNFRDIVIGCCAHYWWDFGNTWYTTPQARDFLIFPALAKEANFFPDNAPALNK